MEDDRLAKRAFLVSAALAGTTQGRSRYKSWAGAAAAVLESLGLPCDLAAPAVIDAEKGVSCLKSAYLSSVTNSELTKVQHYLRMRDGVAPETYCMAPYLKAVGGWRQRKALAQLRAVELLHNLFEVSTDLFRYPGGPRQLLNPDAKSETI